MGGKEQTRGKKKKRGTPGKEENAPVVAVVQDPRQSDTRAPAHRKMREKEPRAFGATMRSVKDPQTRRQPEGQVQGPSCGHWRRGGNMFGVLDGPRRELHGMGMRKADGVMGMAAPEE